MEALDERRSIGIRHERFNAALITATLVNAHRSSESESVSPFDFIPGYGETPEDTEKRKARKAVKQAVALAFTEMKGCTPEQVQAEKRAMIGRMQANGFEDAEDIIREVFPSL